MRIAILSDPHGNSIALDAVLADIEQVGSVNGYWILGDLCAMGPDPVGVIERLQALENAQFVHGNTDSWLVGGVNQTMFENYAELEPDAFRARLSVNDSINWTRGMITASGHRGWLATLPLDFRVTLPDGTRVLCVHAAPGTDDGPGFHPIYEEVDMRERLADANADLVCVGHTHWPMSQMIGDVHLVNASPINLQSAPDFRAKYAMLEADNDGYSVTFRYVEYDREQVVSELKRINHPAADYLSGMIRNGLRAWADDTDKLKELIPPADTQLTRDSKWQ